ncbi:MAG: hypothetical protein EHM35_02305 [Planctomycetaceae bacterium]|nr:MAG: hypothetical protein EHM35_02305 [Planctomycetaceae bacterium]
MWQIVLVACALVGTEPDCTTGVMPFKFQSKEQCEATALALTIERAPLALTEGKCVQLQDS